ncbi:MAG: TolC family protein [Bacteroidaceae bacterium]
MMIEYKRIVCLFWVVVTALSANAQDIYTNVLKEVEEGSTILCALREKMQARQAGNHVGLTPSDPEVEFGYLWSRPAAGGNRKDVSVIQQFDFPTAYIERSRLAGLQDRTCHFDFLLQRQQLLLQAKQTCVELIYQNALYRLYIRQTEWARQIADACKRMVEQGETNRLDYNKAILNLVDMESQLRDADVARKQLAVSLSAMAGGRQIDFDTLDYPAQTLLPENFDLWFAQEASASPALQYLGTQVEASQRRVRVARAEGLPKFSVGYMGELLASQKYNGITIGMSIPLWENKGRIRQAHAELRTAQLEAQNAQVQYYTQLRGLYEQACQQQTNVREMEKALSEGSDESLLYRAYEGGEITLLTYLQENTYYLSVRARLFEARRDLELTLASLTAFSL